MKNAYVLDLAGVICDFDMNTVKGYFTQQEKDNLFTDRKSTDQVIAQAAEAEFEGVLEKGILTGEILYTPTKDVREGVLALQNSGEIVVYSNGTTIPLLQRILSETGIYQPGTIILPGREFGDKAKVESHQKVFEFLSGEGYTPRMFVDDQEPLVVACAQAAYKCGKEIAGLIGVVMGQDHEHIREAEQSNIVRIPNWNDLVERRRNGTLLDMTKMFGDRDF